MNDPSSEPDLLDRLAHEFAERCRRGEQPALSEYADRHPELAAEIRELFPALAVMEAVGSSGRSGGAVLVAEPPVRLGEYRILREVGRGGMGVVYEAIQETLGRHVALKVLPARAGIRGNALERFRREARAAANLHHTNIVPVYGVGEADGVHYYAMQFILGQGLDAILDELRRLRDSTSAPPAGPYSVMTVTLAEYLVSGRFPAPAVDPGLPADPMAATRNGPARSGSTVLSGSSDLAGGPDAGYFRTVARLGSQVAEALAYAHAQGVVHRDMKPSNLLLDAHGTLWVTDFGLAKVEGTDELTRPGDVVGTVRYMAPERFAGKADARSDVYGLGLTLYELLTLRPAFDDADRMRLIDRVRTGDPPRPRSIDSRIPRDLELIVRKATARDPTDRYPTAQGLAADLGRFLRDEPVTARRRTPLLRARKWARRNRTVVTAAALGLALALVAGLVGMAIGLDRANRERDDKVEALRREKQLAYIRRVALAHRELEANSVGRADQLLDECPEQLRGWEWYYLKRLRSGALASFKGHDGQVADVALNGNGSLVASAGNDRTVKLWDTSTGRCLRTFEGHTELVSCVAFSHDDRLLASGSSVKLSVVLPLPFNGFVPSWIELPLQLGEIKVWDTTTRQPVLTIRGHGAQVTKLAFSPDGRWLASASADGTVKIWDAHSEQEVRTLYGHTKGVTGLAFSRDGRQLASASADGTLRIWDPETGREIHNLPGHRDETTGLALSPDGRLVASAGYDFTVQVRDVSTGRGIFETPLVHPAPTLGVTFSPDGQRIASAGWDNTVRLWDATTGQEILTLRHSGFVLAVAFSGDGQVLASAAADGTVRVWDARPMGPKLPLEVFALPHADHVMAVAYSHDGRMLAAASPYQTVTLWDTGTGRLLDTLTGHRGIVWGVALSPDGKHLASASYDRTVIIWDVMTGKQVHTLPHNGHVWCVAYSPDGNRLVTGKDDGGVIVWDATSGEVLLRFRGDATGAVSTVTSPDGKRLVTGGTDGMVHVWDAETGRELPMSPLRGHTDFVRGVACSPDGRYIASASYDGTAKVWDATSGKEIYTLRGHNGMVWCVAFSPDGKQLAAGSGHYGKGEVRIWDAKALEQIAAEKRVAQGK